MLVFLLGFYGKELDLNYSARPLAREIQQQAPDVKLVAIDDIKRDMDYGLAFYRNQPMIHYDTDGVPDEEHLLVIRANDTADLDHWLRRPRLRAALPLRIARPRSLLASTQNRDPR